MNQHQQNILQLLDEVAMMLRDIPPDSAPAETGRLIYQKVREITGIFDPYKAIKAQNTAQALALYPSLKKKVEDSTDNLLTAIRIATMGNVIDFGANRNFDIEAEIQEAFKQDFAIFDYAKFKAHLAKINEILYIADNAGECVFDRVLIEELKKPVKYIVREVPVINDATFEDAVQAGVDKVARILSSGTDAPGTILKTCRPEFNQVYRKSNFIISKGQGNYEALSNQARPIFFLLKAKCRVVADHMGVNAGDLILKAINI
ncbi:MAG: ARMT1-like domain-containing protein [Desulfobacterales bacterium]|jgi:uncharacterized protein with ATP-grasp and redox domains